MNTSIENFDKKEIISWLKLFGATPNEIKEENDNEWHFEFDYPTGTHDRMHIVCPKSYQIVIVNKINIPSQHVGVFNELPANEKREFSLNLRYELTRPEVDFQLEGSNGELLKCPTSIQLSRVRFRDGLTLDSFYETIGHIHKARVSASFFINMHLQDPNTGGNKFGFKTMPN